MQSHPLRVRGLKPMHVGVGVAGIKSHPLRVRGLKLHSGQQALSGGGESHPLRVRGLKRSG